MYDFSLRSGGCADFHRPRAERSIIADNDSGEEYDSSPTINNNPDHLSER